MQELKELSSREAEILRMATEGLIDKEIATSLGLSMTTVRTYWIRIRKKLRAVNRAQSIAAYLELQSEIGRDRDDLAALAKNAPWCLLIVDSDGRIVHSNDKAEQLINSDLPSLTNQPVDEHIRCSGDCASTFVSHAIAAHSYRHCLAFVNDSILVSVSVQPLKANNLAAIHLRKRIDELDEARKSISRGELFRMF